MPKSNPVTASPPADGDAEPVARASVAATSPETTAPANADTVSPGTNASDATCSPSASGVPPNSPEVEARIEEIKQKLQLIDAVRVPTRAGSAVVDDIRTRALVDACSGAAAPCPRRDGILIEIIAPSQAGKTTLLSGIAALPTLQERITDDACSHPLVKVSAPSPCTPKALGIIVIEVIDPTYDVTKLHSRPSHYIWKEVHRLLLRHRVRWLLVDEIHNVMSRGARNDLDALAMTIKALLVDDGWPINVVIAGTPPAAAIVDFSEELANRSRRVRLERFGPSDRNELKCFLEAFEQALAFREPSGLAADDLPDRFLWASKGIRGLIARLIYEAADAAYRKGATKLSRQYLADIYAGKKPCAAAMNPFLATNVAVRAALGRPAPGDKAAPTPRRRRA